MKSSETKSSDKNEKLSICALVLCAGTGTRANLGYNKVLYYAGKKTILEQTLDNVSASLVQTIYVVVSDPDKIKIAELCSGYKNIVLVVGGETRTDSVRRGLNEIGHCDIVVIHDGARPNVSPAVINASIDSAIKHGSGVVAVKTIDSIKEIRNNDVIRSLSRSGLYNIQTPQTFRYDDISTAYAKCDGVYDDDAEVFARAGFVPKIVTGQYDNVKITTPEDLFSVKSMRTKVGVGFDVHKLVKGNALVLGGLRIHHYKGLVGHSDADVLTHAIMDALLSAADLPDIGVLFPNTDPKYKGISSLVLLTNVMTNIYARGYRVGNISAVIMAQKPQLAPFIPEMCSNLASIMQILPQQINISATTTEGLGIVGRESGIAVSASCLLHY